MCGLLFSCVCVCVCNKFFNLICLIWHHHPTLWTIPLIKHKRVVNLIVMGRDADIYLCKCFSNNQLKNFIQISALLSVAVVTLEVGWLFGFYGISTFGGHLMANTVLYRQFIFHTIQFSMSTKFTCQKTFLFQTIQFSQTVKIQLIQLVEIFFTHSYMSK